MAQIEGDWDRKPSEQDKVNPCPLLARRNPQKAFLPLGKVNSIE